MEFICKKCSEEFEAEWNFGEDVQCPNCKTWWETDFDISYVDGSEEILGPWLEKEQSDVDLFLTKSPQ